MKLSPSILTSFLRLVTCAVLALGIDSQIQAQDKKADPAGTWTWTSPGRNGGPERKSTLKLKIDGDKVTGTYASTGGQGGKGGGGETAIENVKFSGDELSFTVTREFNNNKFVQKYAGKISGDSFKGKVEFEINGQSQSRDFDAKREAAK